MMLQRTDVEREERKQAHRLRSIRPPLRETGAYRDVLRDVDLAFLPAVAR